MIFLNISYNTTINKNKDKNMNANTIYNKLM